MNSKDVQMWDNAVFDEAEFLESSDKKPVLSTTQYHESFGSGCYKENVCPSSINVRNLVGISRTSVSREIERKLDAEIKEIERDINRLSARLQDLRLEKSKKSLKVVEKRGRIVPAKFMNPPKKAIRSCDEEKMVEESMNMSAKVKTSRRGMSLGPAEIYSAANRRNSCYWKIQDVDELRVVKQRGKSGSVSPKSRSKSVEKSRVPKQAATSMAVKKTVKKLFVENGGTAITKEIRKGSLVENDEEKNVHLGVKCEGNARIGEGVSARDCGAAKRASESVGKKSEFSENENEFSCEDLSFENEVRTKEKLKIKVGCSMNERSQKCEIVEKKMRCDLVDGDEDVLVFSFEEEQFEQTCIDIN